MSRICYLVADGSEELELVAPVDLLRRAGVQVDVAAVRTAGAALARGSHGIGIAPDAPFDGRAEGYDAIVVPGGLQGVRNLTAAPEVLDALRAAHAAGKWVAAICAGPWVLHAAGVLDGAPYTCYPGCEGEIDGGARRLDRPVVVDADRRVVTSQGAGTAIEFGLALVEALEGRPAAEKVARSVVWKGPFPPCP